MRLGGTDLVNSIVICHPGAFTIDQVKAIKVPTAWVCAEGIYWRLGLYKFLTSSQRICFFPIHYAWLLKLFLLRGRTKKIISIMSSRSTKVRIENFY